MSGEGEEAKWYFSHTLDYTVSSAFEEPENIRQVVPFTSTDCTFGKWRVWFVCPGQDCGRRVGKLYLAGKYFLCRHCHDLTYQSRLEDPAGRARLRAQRMRERLGGDGSLWEPFPEKPKGMRWSTYERLRDKNECASLLGQGTRVGSWEPPRDLSRHAPGRHGTCEE